MTEANAVRNNAALSRFELNTGDGIAVANYRAADGVLTIYHTEVPPQLRERGIASRLIREAMDLVRAKGLKVVPGCDFVRHYMATHPEFEDLRG
jgi:predicted GNAT family acetyltransferase